MRGVLRAKHAGFRSSSAYFCFLNSIKYCILETRSVCARNALGSNSAEPIVFDLISLYGKLFFGCLCVCVYVRERERERERERGRERERA